MILLKNGQTFDTININHRHEIVNNVYRSIFEIFFSADTYSFEEINELKSNPEVLSDIKIYGENCSGDTINYELLSEHYNYTIAVELKETTLNGEECHMLKVAQLTDVEIEVNGLKEQVALLTDCVLELSTQ